MEQHNNINGLAKNLSELSILDRKPIVTCRLIEAFLLDAGDKELFKSLETTLGNSLPQEAAEWRRSYGRAVKSVHVTANFVPFTRDVLPKEGDFRLIDQPMLHTYWTQCSDVDTYKATVRDDIELWMQILVQYNLTDWMIVLVETYDFRKTNKLLPRTTVLDKIRSDFGAKHADRCLSVINPLRSESRSAGSWRGLIVNFRLLLLAAYDRTLLRFEEIIREQRERRNQAGWSFTKYFLLQEELAFVLEMLGVYEEALVQYDELDALFTQFVLNSHLGDSPQWLSQFCAPLESWAGLTISTKINVKERSRIQENSISLLQFRNYLFSRQCAMLLYAKKPWEVAERTLPFLHNVIRELSILEVNTPAGSVPCWVFLSCLEVLQTCETYTESNHVEQYSVFTAGLWDYAKTKLGELGELCGLLPGNEPSSEQIHKVVEISSGLDDSSLGPVEKLKKALSSQQAFCKQYLELSELAMGTFKHIGRVRCARRIGHDLAKFYRSLGDLSKSASFLQNALHCYEQDGWKKLACLTRLELANAYSELDDLSHYVKICASIASSSELDMEVRMKYYNEMVKTLETSNPDPPWTGTLSDCLTVTDVDIQVDKGSTTVNAIVGITSGLPVPINCSTIAVSVISLKQDNKTPCKHKDSTTSRRRNKEDLVAMNPLLQRLPVISRLDYQQDKSLAGANVDIKNQKSLLRRQDSHGKYRKISTVTRSDFSKQLLATEITLQPGQNTVTLTCKDCMPGQYRVGQFSIILMGKMDLLSTATTHKVFYEVTQALPTIALNTVHGDLLAGIHQTLTVDINTAGYHIFEGSCLKMRSSHGLSLKLKGSDESLARQMEAPLPEAKPNSFIQIPIVILAQLISQKDSSSLGHTVSIKAPWAEEEYVIQLSLQPAFVSTLRMHTAKLQKFLHITLVGLSQQKLSVYRPNVTVLGKPGGNVQSLNPPDRPMVVNQETKVGFMWLLEADESADSEQMKTEFSVGYNPVSEEPHHSLTYKCIFDIHNYKTLYLVESRVEPVRGSEFCRVSTVCQLVVQVTRVNDTPDTSLMYEVLAEHNMWAICGRTAGVLNLDSKETQTVTLDVMPLINGFLPLPMVRLSKYIPANNTTTNNSRVEPYRRLEPFSPGEVYNCSKGAQVHVITSVSPQDT